MNAFAQWLNDLRWAANMRRARRWRRQLLFSQRIAFDNLLRPRIGPGTVIDYPDALYHAEIGDLLRAMQGANTVTQDKQGERA